MVYLAETTQEDTFQLLWPYTHISSITTDHLATRGYLDIAFIVSALMAECQGNFRRMQDFLAIESFAEICKHQTVNMESMDTGLFTPLSEVWVSLPNFTTQFMFPDFPVRKYVLILSFDHY